MDVDRSNHRAVEEIHQSIPIPEHKMGWIIGKQGSYINQMSKKSHASITISESTSREFGRIWRYVHIKGGGRAVDKAKKLLHIRLERLEPRDPEEVTMEDNVDAIVSASENVGATSHNYGGGQNN